MQQLTYFRCPVPGWALNLEFHFTIRNERIGDTLVPRTPPPFTISTTPTALPEYPLVDYESMLREVRGSRVIQKRYIVECPADWKIEGVQEAVATAKVLTEKPLDLVEDKTPEDGAVVHEEITKVGAAFDLLKNTYRVEPETMLHPKNKRPTKALVLTVATGVGISFPNL